MWAGDTDLGYSKSCVLIGHRLIKFLEYITKKGMNQDILDMHGRQVKAKWGNLCSRPHVLKGKLGLSVVSWRLHTQND